MAKQNKPLGERKLWIPEIAERFRDLGFQLSEEVIMEGHGERIRGSYELGLKPLPYFQNRGFKDQESHYIALVRAMQAENFLNEDVSSDFAFSLEEYILIATPNNTSLTADLRSTRHTKDNVIIELDEDMFLDTGVYLPACVPRELAKYVATEDSGNFRADRFLKDLFDYALKYKE